MLDEIFKPKSLTKKGVPSIKIVAGIIGNCWIKPMKNREIANKLSVSDAVISDAVNNHLKRAEVLVIEPSSSEKRFKNNLNFLGIVEYFSEISDWKGDQNEIVSAILFNRKSVGKSFIDSFVLGKAYEYGLNKVSHLYKTIPELLFLLIMSLDATAPKNQVYLHFLRSVYRSIMLKAQEDHPELVYVWSGLTWFMMDFDS